MTSKVTIESMSIIISVGDLHPYRGDIYVEISPAGKLPSEDVKQALRKVDGVKAVYSMASQPGLAFNAYVANGFFDKSEVAREIGAVLTRLFAQMLFGTETRYDNAAPPETTPVRIRVKDRFPASSPYVYTVETDRRHTDSALRQKLVDAGFSKAYFEDGGYNLRVEVRNGSGWNAEATKQAVQSVLDDFYGVNATNSFKIESDSSWDSLSSARRFHTNRRFTPQEDRELRPRLLKISGVANAYFDDGGYNLVVTKANGFFDNEAIAAATIQLLKDYVARKPS